jgi:hypothetical protein
MNVAPAVLVVGGIVERFPAKWVPVRVKKTRQNKAIEPRSDSIGTEKALVARIAVSTAVNSAGREMARCTALFLILTAAPVRLRFQGVAAA